MKINTHILAILFTMIFAGCQSVPEAGNGLDGTNGTNGDNGDGGLIEWCNNNEGDLSCYDFGDLGNGDGNGDDVDIGSVTFIEDVFDQCMASCEDSTESCKEQCAFSAVFNSITGLPPSDPVSIPEPVKAIKVEMNACYTIGIENEIHFQGNLVSFKSLPQGPQLVSSVINTLITYLIAPYFPEGSSSFPINLHYEVGRNPQCDQEYLESDKNLLQQVHIKFTPVKDSTIDFGDANIDVVPFRTSAPTVEDVVKFPASTSFGLPRQIRELEEIDLTQVLWVLAGEDTNSDLATSSGGAVHYNNNIEFGKTIIFRYFVANSQSNQGSALEDKIMMYMFVKSNDTNETE